MLIFILSLSSIILLLFVAVRQGWQSGERRTPSHTLSPLFKRAYSELLLQKNFIDDWSVDALLL